MVHHHVDKLQLLCHVHNALRVQHNLQRAGLARQVQCLQAFTQLLHRVVYAFFLFIHLLLLCMDALIQQVDLVI